MKPFRELAIEQYAQHYDRINLNINPHKTDPKRLGGMDLTYGKFLHALPEDSKVLDLGCGTGHLLYWLSLQEGITPIGVDSSSTQVATARKYLPILDISCEDGLIFLSKHPDTFSGIFCMDVLEHIPTLDLSLEWLKAIQIALKPNGFFICRVPNAANLTGGYSRYMDLTHERSFTSASLLQLLELSGLQNCQVVPIKLPHWSGKIRLLVEELLHIAIFRVCGRGLKEVFTYNVCAVGFKV